MAKCTSGLLQSTLTKLSQMALKLNVPKNRIIERALDKYLTEIERQMYIRSFRNLTGDGDMLIIAEECMEEYNLQLVEWRDKR